MSDQTVTAIVTAAAGLLLVLLVRWALRLVLRRWLRAVEQRRGVAEAAGMRTRLVLLERLVVAFVVVIVIWQVLSVYPETEKLANAVLASSAVIALFVGLAFSTPLSNLGAGILLAFTQPVRIGDRVSVGDVTGTAEEITLIHTVLVSDASTSRTRRWCLRSSSTAPSSTHAVSSPSTCRWGSPHRSTGRRPSCSTRRDRRPRPGSSISTFA